MVLDRDMDYFSLVESIEQPLEFTGNNADGDGGYQYIKEARDAGIDTQVTFLSEISWDAGTTYETLFEGLLDLTTLIEIENKRRFQCTLLRTSLWSKFINRKGVQVDIVASGAAVQTTTLPSQVLRKSFRSESYQAGDPNAANTTYNTDTTNKYGVIELSNRITDEIETKFTLIPGVQDVVPTASFKVKEAGDYVFDIAIYLVATSTVLGEFAAVDMYIQFGTAAPVALTETNLGIDGLSGRTRYTYSSTETLIVGDEIRLYIQDDSGLTNATFISPLNPETSYIDIQADTVAPESTASGFYINDVALGIVLETADEFAGFYSEYFGSPVTQTVDYDLYGCGSFFQVFKGINVRGQSLSDFPFTMSFDDLWDGINNIFCLGLGYEVVSFSTGGGGGAQNKEVIRIEPREYFFDSSSNSVEFNVFEWNSNLEISYDPSMLITSVDIGYKKWESESLVGTDDPQTKHTYQSRFKTVGTKDQKNVQILSGLYAASVGIEQTRRKTFEPSKDWRLDEETFIIQVDGNEDVKTYSASLITNLLNADSRYNVRLTPASNFNRWLNWLSNAFQNYVGDFFRFIGGEGNINMTFNDPSATGCDAEPGTSVNERADIQIGSAITLPTIYKFAIPMQWEQWVAIRDNRTKSIGLTYPNNQGVITPVSLFIKKLSYQPNKSQADFECWLATPAINVTVEYSGVSATWVALIDGVAQTVTVTGPTDSETELLDLPIGLATVSASKSSNGGLAQGAGSVLFYQNGAVVDTQNFVDTQNVSNINFQYDLAAGDVIKVVITEGL